MRKKIEKSSSSNKTVRVWDFRTETAIIMCLDERPSLRLQWQVQVRITQSEYGSLQVEH